MIIWTDRVYCRCCRAMASGLSLVCGWQPCCSGAVGSGFGHLALADCRPTLPRPGAHLWPSSGDGQLSWTLVGVDHCFARPGIRPLCVLISPSTDGEMIRRVVEGLGMRTARGSSGRDGARGFIELLRSVRSMPGVPVGFLVDGGGKGPRGRCKPGAAALALRAGAVIQPAVASARPAFIAKRSWDRFLVPLPFARVELRFGRPFLASADQAETQAQIEASLVRLVREADHSTRLIDDAGFKPRSGHE